MPTIKPDANIAVSFHLIHNIITRGLQVSADNVQSDQKFGYSNGNSREGLYKYIRALTSVLNTHHLTEDDVVFPYFRDKLPEAPFDGLTHWHREMDKMLTDINLALDKCEQNDQLEMNMDIIENALTKLKSMWPAHIQIEYDEIISKVDSLVPVEEQFRLVRLFSEHGQKIGTIPELAVPFLLYNLPPEDRKEFSKDIPEEILQHLVPHVWRINWEVMTPYLLT